MFKVIISQFSTGGSSTFFKQLRARALKAYAPHPLYLVLSMRLRLLTLLCNNTFFLMGVTPGIRAEAPQASLTFCSYLLVKYGFLFRATANNKQHIILNKTLAPVGAAWRVQPGLLSVLMTFGQLALTNKLYAVNKFFKTNNKPVLNVGFALSSLARQSIMLSF